MDREGGACPIPCRKRLSFAYCEDQGQGVMRFYGLSGKEGLVKSWLACRTCGKMIKDSGRMVILTDYGWKYAFPEWEKVWHG
jgi:hypothetical protein